MNDFLNSLNPAWIPAVASGITAVAGLGAALIGVFFTSSKQHAREVKGTRSAIRAEITALQAYIALGGYRELLRQVVEKLEAGDRASIKFEAERSFSKVYDSNLERIGHLGSAAGPAVAFYMTFEGMLADGRFGHYEWSHLGEEPDPLDRAEDEAIAIQRAALYYRALLEKLDMCQSFGDRATDLLRPRLFRLLPKRRIVFTR